MHITTMHSQPQPIKKLNLTKETIRRLQTDLVLVDGGPPHEATLKTCGEITLTCRTCPIICI